MSPPPGNYSHREFDGKLAGIGGTVIIGEDLPIELNPFTARLLRA